MIETADPIVNALNRPFWDGANAGELRLPHCHDTGRAFWPPSAISPFTSGSVDWRTVDPDGRIESLVVYRRAFQQAFAHLLPYGIALVELPCGPRLMVHVEQPGAMEAGSAVIIRFKRLIAGQYALPIAVLLKDQITTE